MSKQVVAIHGGDTFETYEEYLAFLKSFKIESLDYFKRKGWRVGLQEKLGSEFEVITPQMPNKINAKYSEWKIWFDKLAPLLSDEVVLVGYSLGAIFLVKYLAENEFPKKIRGTFLAAAPFDVKDADYSLADFTLPEDLSMLEKQGGEITFYQSEDDPVVPFADLGKYKDKVQSARTVALNGRGHFWQDEFPELEQDVRNLFV